MEKLLKKYTTIPQHLYVNRNADEQLKRIVIEMQRPGYVLVARQMGKTNLLFNAKRTLENDKRLFVYVDLSNVFNNEIDCYRNIIDNILEPNEELFVSIEEEIKDIRAKNLPSHKEYSRCLRSILAHFNGDIVIVLDEIDALRSATYSDNIFAQIRSNYFSRTNFPEFERLTYILSGVIEPTELIKDRNKSPFNIGEKIYLDDFTKEEHDSFILKSNLFINSEVSDEIFNWTNGNPRLTFDISSEVEDLLFQNGKITKEEIESLIKKKYLTTYDIAPIDHIRELVKSNKQVRNAVQALVKKDKILLSDELKRKLYLYGITNSNFEEDTQLKNPIIAKSLSEDWINSINRKNKNLTLTYGLAYVDNKEFDEAVDIFNEILTNTNPSKQELESINYFLGFSYYNLRKFDKALEKFSFEFEKEEFIRNSLALGGICKIATDKKEDGFKDLEKTLEVKKDDFAYHSALLNLANHLPDSQKEKALDLYYKLYDSTFNAEDRNEQELNLLRSVALYYQAEILNENNETEKAINKLNEALKYSSPSDSLYIKYFLNNLVKEDKEAFKRDIVNTIIFNNIKFDANNSYPISFCENHLILYLELVFDQNNPELLFQLFDYIDKNLYQNELEKYKLLYYGGRISSSNTEILEYLLEFQNNIDSNLRLQIHRDLLFKKSPQFHEFFPLFEKYEQLLKNSSELLIGSDIYLFAIAIRLLSDRKKINEALELCRKIDNKTKDIEEEEIKFETVIIFYWYANLYFSLKNREETIRYADITIDLITNSKRPSTSMVDEKGLKSLKEQMVQIKNSSILQKPIQKLKKYGRNEKVKVKYLDGTIIENKYKKLEADIMAERCKII